MSDEPTCNPHPCAVHGFDRTGSHVEDRYVCTCEGWSPAYGCVGLELEAECDRLTRFRGAVVGWREFDWPEGFCRKTAEMLAENAKRVEASGHE